MYIGMDVGGSNTRIVVLDENQQVLAHDNLPGAATADSEADHVIEDLVEALKPWSALKHVGVNLAGDNVNQVKKTIQAALPMARVHVAKETEGDVPLYLGRIYGCSIVVLAGTGSVCLAESPNGQRTVSGGLGPIFDDDGSGYRIGKEAIRHLIRVGDGRETGPSMIELPKDLPVTSAQSASGGKVVTSELPRETLAALRHWAEALSRPQIAQFSKAVVSQAQAGHGQAQALLAKAGTELATLAVAVARRLQLTGKCGVLVAGGLANAWEYLEEGFLAKLKSAAEELGIDFHIERNSSRDLLAMAAAFMASGEVPSKEVFQRIG